MTSYLHELLRPWKLATFAAGLGLLIAGSFCLRAPDWDVPISIIMATCTYLSAPEVLRVILERRWRLLPVALLAAWFSIDGCYWIYWSLRNPQALTLMRDANFFASLALYGTCAIVWLYRGSVRELCADAKSLRLSLLTGLGFSRARHRSRPGAPRQGPPPP